MLKVTVKNFILLLLILLNTVLIDTHADENSINHDILALDENIKHILDQNISHIRPKTKRLNALHDLLYGIGSYNIQYHESKTQTAIDTFYSKYGNCISLANLFIASARHVGLDARYQSVKIEQSWQRKEGYYELVGHINVLVLLPQRMKAEIEFNQAIFHNFDIHKMKKEIITDERALAEFYNNLGVDSFDKKNLQEAVSYFKKATSTYKDLDFAWSNLGVTHKKLDRYKLAENAYLMALKANPRSHTATSNIFKFYKQTGEPNKAKKYQKKAEKHAKKNPYYLEKLAEESINSGDYKKAKDLSSTPKYAKAYKRKLKTFNN